MHLVNGKSDFGFSFFLQTGRTRDPETSRSRAALGVFPGFPPWGAHRQGRVCSPPQPGPLADRENSQPEIPSGGRARRADHLVDHSEVEHQRPETRALGGPRTLSSRGSARTSRARPDSRELKLDRRLKARHPELSRSSSRLLGGGGGLRDSRSIVRAQQVGKQN